MKKSLYYIKKIYIIQYYHYLSSSAIKFRPFQSNLIIWKILNSYNTKILQTNSLKKKIRYINIKKINKSTSTHLKRPNSKSRMRSKLRSVPLRTTFFRILFYCCRCPFRPALNPHVLIFGHAPARKWESVRGAFLATLYYFTFIAPDGGHGREGERSKRGGGGRSLSLIVKCV